MTDRARWRAQTSGCLHTDPHGEGDDGDEHNGDGDDDNNTDDNQPGIPTLMLTGHR